MRKMQENKKITKDEYEVFRTILGDLTEHKRYAIDAAKLAAISDWSADRAPKMLACGTYVAMQPRDTGEGWEIVASNFCRLRLCPMCAWRRSLRLYGQLLRVVDALPGYEWLLVTLTVPNVVGTQLGATLSEMNKSSRELLKLPECVGWAGWLRATEVTYNSDRDDYHPHYHLLVAVKPTYFHGRNYVAVKKLRALWRRWWPTASQVDVRKVADCRRGCCEVAKYATKPLIFPADAAGQRKYAQVFDTLRRQLHGRRLICTAGVIKDTLKALQIDLESEDTAGTEDAAKEIVRLTWYDSDMMYHPCRER